MTIEERIARIERLIAKLEWSGVSIRGHSLDEVCPICREEKWCSHSDDCEMGKIVRALEEGEEGGA